MIMVKILLAAVLNLPSFVLAEVRPIQTTANGQNISPTEVAASTVTITGTGSKCFSVDDPDGITYDCNLNTLGLGGAPPSNRQLFLRSPSAAITFESSVSGEDFSFVKSQVGGAGILWQSNNGSANLGSFADNGRVGINTITPATLLDVNGESQFGSGATKSTFTATGKLGMITGTASLPSLFWNGDTQTGLYQPFGVNTLATSIAGVVSQIWNARGVANQPIWSTDAGNATGIDSPATGKVGFIAAGTQILTATSGGVGIGTASPASKLHISSGIVTIDGTSTGLRISSGPTAGALVSGWFCNTASLDFAAIIHTVAGFQDLTISVPGAGDGDDCTLGVPNALASTSGLQFSCFVSASDVVTVRMTHTGVETAGAQASSADPAAATVRSCVFKH